MIFEIFDPVVGAKRQVDLTKEQAEAYIKSANKLAKILEEVNDE